ncbi:MAG TPA: hypothetical protein VHW09_31985 [Bryobacteraceae bacterium]|jgi:hypothetical protein|nr:hypothetical protein [Bryobacteraceae bacterium]
MLSPDKTNSQANGYPKVVPIRGYGSQLEGLYARRSAVESLIESLEEYQRFRAQRIDRRETRTA